MKNWTSGDKITASKPDTLKMSFSALIPARNEAQNIGKCIEALISNELPTQTSLEIIIIDDHSEDQTSHIVSSYHDEKIKLISLADYIGPEKINSYKKEAINYGLSMAQGDYIIQLDADSVVGSNYINSLYEFLSYQEAEFVAGPILFSPASGCFQQFQVLDMMGMMAVTMVGIKKHKWYLANGANMVYKNVGAPVPMNHLASGDDIHRIQEFTHSNKESIHFLKDKRFIVRTKPVASVNAFISQRLRWATKNKMMPNPLLLLVMSVPFINAILIISHMCMYVVFGPIIILVFVTHLLFKMSIDYIYLKTLSEFFNTQKSLKHFLLSTFFHLGYMATIGIMSLFIKKYTWKDRVVQ